MVERNGNHQFEEELQRAIAGPISAKIQTMNDSSFLVFNDKILDEDSDQEDFERYQDVGLREQLFITLSRAIKQSEQSNDTKITETSIPDSIKQKRSPTKKRLNTSSSSSSSSSSSISSSSIYNNNNNNNNQHKSYSKYGGHHHHHHHHHHHNHHHHKNKKMRAYDNHTPRQSSPMNIPISSKKKRLEGPTKALPSNPRSSSSSTSNHRSSSKPPSSSSTKHKKKHRREQSNIRHYAKRSNDFGVASGSGTDFDSSMLDESDDDDLEPIPLKDTNAPKIKTRNSDHDITTTLEQVRKDKSEEILSNLPPTSQTPKMSKHGKVDIASRFNMANNMNLMTNKTEREKKRSTHKHSSRKQSSRGFPPPPGQPDYYKDNNMKRIKKRHSDKVKSSVIPPPPSSPAPLLDTKEKNKSNFIHNNANISTRGRQIRHSEWKQHQKPLPPQNQAPQIQQRQRQRQRQRHQHHGHQSHQPHQPLMPPTSKSAYNERNDPRRNVQKYKHSYNGPSLGPTLPIKSNNNNNSNKNSNNNNNNNHNNYYHKRSHSKDRIEIKKQTQNIHTLQSIAIDVDDNSHPTPTPNFENSISLPIAMKVDPITGKLVASSAGIPPPPGSIDILKQRKHKPNKQNLNNGPPSQINLTPINGKKARPSSHSVAITTHSPNISPIIKAQSSTPTPQQTSHGSSKLISRVKIDNKYNTMTPAMFSQISTATNDQVKYKPKYKPKYSNNNSPSNSHKNIHNGHSNHSNNNNNNNHNGHHSYNNSNNSISDHTHPSSFGRELSVNSNISDYSQRSKSNSNIHSNHTFHSPQVSHESLSRSHSYNNSGGIVQSQSHSPQNSENTFIPPAPQWTNNPQQSKSNSSNSHSYNNHNSIKQPKKHRPKTPMQVYQPNMRRNKLEKMKTPKLSSQYVANNGNIPTHTNVNLHVAISALRLDALPDDNNGNNNISPSNTVSPLSELSQLSALKDGEENENDTRANIVSISPDTPTRNRANNLFQQEEEDEKPAFTIQVSTDNDNPKNNDNKDDDEDPGESDIPTGQQQMSDWIAASAICVDPTLDPRRAFKNKLNKNPIKNIRTRAATFIGKTNNDTIGPLNNKIEDRRRAAKLSPSTTSPALGARVNRADSLADRFNRFKGAQMNDGSIVLPKRRDNAHSHHSELNPDQLMKQFQKGFPDFEDLHQRFALEYANKIYDGHLKSYQRAFMPITPKHLGLMDFGHKRDRRRAVFDSNKLLSKPYINLESSMEISNEIRNKAIGKFIAQQDLAQRKRFKKSFGHKDSPKKKNKKPKLSYSSRKTSDSLSYSLSISIDVPSTASHKSTSSIHTPNHIYLYSDHYSKSLFEIDDNGKKSKKPWQKLFSFGMSKKRKKKNSNYSDEYIEESQSYKSLTLDDPSDVANANRHKLSSHHKAAKDDMFSDIILNSRYSIHGFDFEQSMYKTSFQINEITQTIDATNLKRGDIICIMDYEMIDVENEDLNSFLTKYKMQNFLKRMEAEEKRRQIQLQMAREQSTMRLLSKQKSLLHPKKHKFTESNESIFSNSANSNNDILYSSPNSNNNNASSHRPRGREINTRTNLSKDLQFLSEELKLSDDYKMLEEWRNQQGAAHVMIVLQNIGSSIEVAHVTSHGGTRSFIRQFNAEKIAQTIYQRIMNNKHGKHNKDNDHHEEKYNDNNDNNPKFRTKRSISTKSTQLVEALGRGPPVAYRCIVYRLNTDVVHSRKFANEAANVAENLVKGGRVLGDPAVFAGSTERYMENPEKYFYRFLLSSNASLFRRTVRLQFDEGNSFFNFSSSEFIALCFQRALVNKKSFDRQLIRLLDFCPHLTPPPLLQKYIHLNIDEHGDWKCLGNIFFSYL